MDRKETAWSLVRSYIDTHLASLPETQRPAFAHTDETTISPLGALVKFEMARQRLSFNAASQYIARCVPDGKVDRRLSPTGLFYFTKPDRMNQRAEPDTLFQLSLAFGWSLDWLRRVNMEMVEEIEVSPLVKHLAELLNEMPELTAHIDRLVELTGEERRVVAQFTDGIYRQNLATRMVGAPLIAAGAY